MSQEEIQKLVEVRMMLLQSFTKHKDWRNKNAIMREIDHIETVGEAIKKIDVLLSGHVTFS